MSRFLLSLFLLSLLAVFNIRADVQEQEPEDHEHLVVHVKELERNLTELWTRVHDLEKATLAHLTHIRHHQIEIEGTLKHIGHNDGHHDEHHSSGHKDDHNCDHVGHGDDHHSTHSDDHHDDHHGNHSGHGDDHDDNHHDSSHSSSDHHDDHHSSHDDDHHSEHHSSYDDHHSSSTNDHHHDHHDDQKSSSGDDHGHHDNRHGDHSKEKDDHGHHGDHHGDHSKEKDDHSTEHDDHSKEHDDHHQAKDVAEPLIVPMKHKSHSYHDNRQTQQQNKEDVLSQFSRHASNHGKQNQSYIPTMQDRYLLNFAECEVHPNSALDPEVKQNVFGKVSFWQKKEGGPLGIYVHLQGFKVDGHQDLQQHDDSDHNEVPITGHGHKHGFHVHDSGEIASGCQSAGPHLNPEHVNHGGPHSSVRHVGDFGNIECDEHGIVDIVFYDNVATLNGDQSILDHGLVIHENEDDFGTHPDDPESLATGNAGAGIACCTIHSSRRFSLRTFKNIKQAASHHHR